MNCPATVHFHLYAYASFEETQTFKDADGNPLDFTDCTALMHIRRDINDALPLFIPVVTLGGAAGTVTVRLTNSQTGLVKIDPDGETWQHDLLITYPSALVERTYQGAVYAYWGVTRPAIIAP